MGLEKGFEGKPGKSELEMCPECKGTGTVKDSKGQHCTCNRCNGRGKLPAPR